MKLPAWLIMARWRIDVAMAALWTLAGGAVWLLAVRPLLDHAAEASRQQEALASLGQQQEIAQNQLADLVRRSAAAKVQIAAATVRPVALSSQNQRQAQITDLAESIGRSRAGALRVEQLAWGTPVKGARYTAVGLRLAGTATYTACREFLSAIHTQFPDTGVVAFKLAGSPDIPGAPANLTLELVWYAAPPGAAKTPTPSVPEGASVRAPNSEAAGR